MSDATMNTDPRPGTLQVPGAHLYYEIRGQGPLIALIGAPMDADAFAPLAGQLATDHTVLTCDPRRPQGPSARGVMVTGAVAVSPRGPDRSLRALPVR